MEIERKFLIWENGNSYATPTLLEHFTSVPALREYVLSDGIFIRQGYLPLDNSKAMDIFRWAKPFYADLFSPVEARLRQKGEKFIFTVKGEGNLTRNEWEANISSTVFEKAWGFTEGKRIEKQRAGKKLFNCVVDFDCYVGRDLITAEAELPTEEQALSFPNLGLDVTGDKKYKNKNLAS